MAPDPSTDAQRMGIFERLSREYDKKISMDENLLLFNYYRWRLVSQARGKVLEVAAGTGRNIPSYYFNQRSAGWFLPFSLWHPFLLPDLRVSLFFDSSSCHLGDYG